MNLLRNRSTSASILKLIHNKKMITAYDPNIISTLLHSLFYICRNIQYYKYWFNFISSITGDFIASNKISVEKYFLDEHLESCLKTKTRSAVSVCIDYIYGLILLPKRKNMSKMAIYCCKCSNNRYLSHFISNSPLPSTNLLIFVRTKAIDIIGEDCVIILTNRVWKNQEIVLLEFLISTVASWVKLIVAKLESSSLILRAIRTQYQNLVMNVKFKITKFCNWSQSLWYNLGI